LAGLRGRGTYRIEDLVLERDRERLFVSDGGCEARCACVPYRDHLTRELNRIAGTKRIEIRPGDAVLTFQFDDVRHL
jgi:hypothetical protein